MQLIHVRFDEFTSGLEGWADIRGARSWGMRSRVNDAAVKGHVEHDLVRVAEYIESWSLERSPRDAEFVDGLDETIVLPLINRAEAHYARRRLSVDARKSDGGAALSPDGDQDLGPDRSGEPEAAGEADDAVAG